MRSAVRLLPLFVLGALISCNSGEEAEEETREVPQYSVEEFLDNTSVFGASFSPDDQKILVSSDESGIFNAYAFPIDGSEPVQLTHSTTDAVLVHSYFPEDERFLYSSDQGGNELTHIYVAEPSGDVTDITPGEKLKANFLGWADDDRTFFISTNERDNRFFDIYQVGLAPGYERTLIYEDTTGYQFGTISPDERYIAFVKPRTTTDSDIYLYDRETAEMRNITPHEGEVTNDPETFSPDGASLYLLTNDGSEFQYLVRYDLESGEREVIEKPDWDVWYAYLSENGKYMVVGVNEDARTRITVYEAATMEPIELPKLPAGDLTSVAFSSDERLMAFYVNSSRTPGDLFVHNLAGDREPRQLTHTLSAGIDAQYLVEGEVVRFASYDGVEIPGILYKPYQAGPDARSPALVWVHGGPGGQSRLTYNALIQYVANHGYTIYAINNRGSGGYGKTFYQMDDHKHGDADLGDVVASKKMLGELGYVDAERIGIIGGSYGGYMVLAALAFEPEEFDVGVDIFGVANWIRTLESIPSWWESYREALYKELGNPETDRDYLRGMSPLFHANRITKPLIVLQGANDPRVPKVESDEIVKAVRDNGVPVEYIVFEDEGHGFRKKENRVRGYRAILEFLDTYLKGGGAASEEKRTAPESASNRLFRLDPAA
jgi:dipeptidyl aminopeptidase/acylaminoacyl peptidase